MGFEKARMRFKAAQKIQALARGHLARRRIAIWRKWIVGAAVRVQRVWRGHRYRNSLWTMVLDQRATHIQATVRGYHVRNRRFHLLAEVVMIQRFYRQWPDTLGRESVKKGWMNGEPSWLHSLDIIS